MPRDRDLTKDEFDSALVWVKENRPKSRLIGNSMSDGNGNHFIVHCDENGKPNYFEWNGKEVTEAQYRMLRAPSFP